MHVTTNQLYRARVTKHQRNLAAPERTGGEQRERIKQQKQQRRVGYETEREREADETARLTCALDVLDTFLDEERDGSIRGHQVLQGDAKVVALPGSSGGRVQRFGGLGGFRL